jgi:hypothetical protein
MQIELPEDITPEQVAKMYVAAVLEYQLAELNAKESSSQPEKAAEELFKTKLGATKISEEKHTHKFAYADDENGNSGSFCECGEEEPAKAPWEKPAEPAAAKPWENQAPKVSLF